MNATQRSRVEVQGFTIDSETTRDIDDAICVELVTWKRPTWADPNGAPSHYWRVLVSIADVASIVQADSNEDREARKQVTTKYYAQGNSPMLPRRLSENEASLWPHLPRNTLTTEIHLSLDLRILETRVYRSVLTSRAKLAYSDIAKILADKTNPLHDSVDTCRALAQQLLEKRRSKGALVLYDMNNGWVATEEGYLKRLDKRTDTVGFIIIQELMILANSAMSEWAITNEVPILYRNHTAAISAPSREDLQAQIDGVRVIPVEDLDTLRQRTHLVLRRAEYEPFIRGHYGLNLPAYTHMTSPIRRYADLINQRQVTASILNEPFPYSMRELADEAQHINDILQQEREEVSRRFKEKAENVALSRIEAGRLDALNAKDFERVVKMEARSGRDPSENFIAAFERRLRSHRIPSICMTAIFLESPQTPKWNELRSLLLKTITPSVAVTIVTQAATIAKWPLPKVTISDSGPAHAKTFSATATIQVNDQTFVTPAYFASSSQIAKQRSFVGLLAAIYNLEAPVFEMLSPPTAQTQPVKEPVLDETKNPIQSVLEHAQSRCKPSPVFNFEERGPQHQREFTCTCSYLDLQAAGKGHTKRAAKTSAARSMVTLLANTGNAKSPPSPSN